MRRSVLEDFVYMSEAHVQIDEINQHRDCPSRTLLSNTDSISLCPTYQSLDRDERRTPSDILQTRCRCDRCAMRRRRRYQYRCTPVFRYIPVLMRVGCTDGIYDYMVAEEKVSVSCVCTEKNKFKQNRKTVSSVEERVKYSVSGDIGSILNKEKMPINYENRNQSQPEQSRDVLERMPYVYKSPEHATDYTHGEYVEGEVQEHHSEESFPETEKMPITNEVLDKAVDSTEGIQSETQLLTNDKNPDKLASREDVIESTEQNAATPKPNRQYTTETSTNRDSKENGLTPGNRKIPAVYDDIHGHYTNNERMPK
ncbi:uncharacterized protein LOC117339752 [Pecten maximus]|uniref:uncharacterized protein LOC117339752 n=1 Tax=Pecten maximus TaxID=6579 RepID=UPI001458789A|nr:uncharacterized protein LOC117339752 [Pecten maximus]